MDIYCPRCSEPWDTDTFHDVADEQDITYSEALARFYRDGCSATGWCRPCTPTGNERVAVSAAMYDLLGDDVDGIASMLDDYESWR